MASSKLRSSALGPREFIFFMALVSAMSALAIDMLLPAFSEMRPAFNLSADATDLSLTLTVFFVGAGVGQLFAGPLADSFGRRRLFFWSMSLYGIAAIACALAPTLWFLLVARFVWGLAASGPRILTQAIVRDHYAGDAMARVMTLVQASFMIAPVVAPLIGAGIVAVASWRWVLAFGAITALLTMLWGTRLQESLDPEHRRAFDPLTVIRGYGTVMAHPVSRWYIIAVTLAFSAFYSFLGSTELVFDDVFDQAGWFVPYFSIVSASFGVVAFGCSRFLRRWPGTRLITGAGIGLVVCSGALLVAALAADGRPPFWLFLILFSLVNACHVAFFPTANSLALEPMGELAGTAAAVLGVTTGIVGAFLASFIDRAIDGTITPLAIGYTTYTAASLAAQLRATAHRRSAAPAGTSP